MVGNGEDTAIKKRLNLVHFLFGNVDIIIPIFDFSELADLIFQGGLRVTEKLKSPRSPCPARWVSASALGNMLHSSAKSLQLRHSVDTLMIHIDTSSIHIDTKPWFALGFALCVEHSMGFDKCAMSCGH